jgi:hypothetical protein
MARARLTKPVFSRECEAPAEPRNRSLFRKALGPDNVQGFLTSARSDD